MRSKIIELLVILFAVAAVGNAGSREVRIALHLDPELPLDGTENVFVGPILIEPREGENVQSVDLTAAREFEIFLRKILRRDAQLHLIPKREDLRPPRNNLAALLLDTEFWKAIREESARGLRRCCIDRCQGPRPRRLYHRGVRLTAGREDLFPPGHGRGDRLQLRHSAGGGRGKDRLRSSTGNRSPISNRRTNASSRSTPICSPICTPFRTDWSASSCHGRCRSNARCMRIDDDERDAGMTACIIFWLAVLMHRGGKR